MVGIEAKDPCEKSKAIKFAGDVYVYLMLMPAYWDGKWDDDELERRTIEIRKKVANSEYTQLDYLEGYVKIARAIEAAQKRGKEIPAFLTQVLMLCEPVKL